MVLDRRIATRYDRCAHTFTGAICIAAIVIFWLWALSLGGRGADPRDVLAAPYPRAGGAAAGAEKHAGNPAISDGSSVFPSSPCGL
jgi:hypothetical protein